MTHPLWFVGLIALLCMQQVVCATGNVCLNSVDEKTCSEGKFEVTVEWMQDILTEELEAGHSFSKKNLIQTSKNIVKSFQGGVNLVKVETMLTEALKKSCGPRSF